MIQKFSIWTQVLNFFSLEIYPCFNWFVFRPARSTRSYQVNSHPFQFETRARSEAESKGLKVDLSDQVWWQPNFLPWQCAGNVIFLYFIFYLDKHVVVTLSYIYIYIYRERERDDEVLYRLELICQTYNSSHEPNCI